MRRSLAVAKDVLLGRVVCSSTIFVAVMAVPFLNNIM